MMLKALPILSESLLCLRSTPLHSAITLAIFALPLLCTAILCHSWALLCHAMTSPSVTLPTQCLTLLCRCFTALIGSDQYHTGAHLRSTVPIQCCSMPLLNCDTHRNSQALRLDALLCRSYTCPCQCSATPLICYSMPKPSAPLLCPNMATLRLALAPRFFSLPARLFSMPRLCPSMPGPFIAIQCLYFAMPVLSSRCSASATRHLASAQLIFAVPLLRFSSQCHRLNVLYSAHALKLTATAIHRYSVPLHR